MKYTSIQGTGVVAHRTELTVEEKYAVMNVIELAMFAGDTKPDFSKLLLRKVCGLATVLVAEPQCKDKPQCEDNTMVLANAIDELGQIIDQARRSIDDDENDISTSGRGLKITPSFVMKVQSALHAADKLYSGEPSQCCEHELLEFMLDLMKRIKEA